MLIVFFPYFSIAIVPWSIIQQILYMRILLMESDVKKALKISENKNK